MLYNDALPFYQDHCIPVRAVLTDNGREFCRTETHPFGLYLAFTEFRHRPTRCGIRKTHGLAKRFHRAVNEQFFEVALRVIFYESLEVLHSNLNCRLVYYNTEHPHLGYWNLGKRPIDAVDAYFQCHAGNFAVQLVPLNLSKNSPWSTN